MPNTKLHTAISTPRFNRYLLACNNNWGKAKKLYRTNLKLSQKMYSVIGIFEVILRNSIDRHLSRLKGPLWLEDAVLPNGFLNFSKGCEISVQTVKETIRKLGSKYSHDNLIANLTFGFWAYQFSKKEFAASGSTLLQIFSRKPHGIRQRDIHKMLFQINQIRNRIAHYEPICFDKSGKISSFPIQKRYDLIIEMLGWLGCPQRKILYGIDEVQKILDVLRAI